MSSTPKLSEVARHLVLPSGIVSTGWPAVRETCRNLGIGFDAWQDGAGRAILGKRADGLYAADAIVLSIPRQVGKTYLIGWIIFALCLVRPGLTVIWTAHRYKTATETYESMRAMALRPRMRPHVSKVPQGAGNQAVIFRNGSRVLFGARERGFGRGFTGVDVLVFDEAQILTDNAIDDMVPATNHAPNPLVFFMGTPPKPTDPGEVFARHRAEALSGEADDELYIEMSADRDADPLDRAQWSKANPSYPSRTTARAMLRMRKNLTDEAFLREGLGIWDDLDLGKRLPASGWSATARDVRPTGRPVLFVTIEPGMRSATIAVAAYEDGVPHVELADHRPGTEWLGARLRELRRTHGEGGDEAEGLLGHLPVGAGKAGPVAGMVDERGELDGTPVEFLTSAEWSQACGLVERLVAAGALTHSDEPLVSEALNGLAVREQDQASWVIDWRKSHGNVAPLAAEIGALFLLERHRGAEYDLMSSFG